MQRRPVLGTITIATSARKLRNRWVSAPIISIAPCLLTGVTFAKPPAYPSPNNLNPIQSPKGISPKWKLVWEDTFSGHDLNRSHWITIMHWAGAEGLHYHNSQYLSYATTKDIVVNHGILHLLTRNQTIHGTSPTGTFHYTEGMINSYSKFSRTYGYFEIYAR